MAKLGSKQNPLILNLHDEETLGEVSKLCDERGWHFIAGFDLDEPEDLYDLSQKVYPETRVRELKVGRNDPCPCGSGKKFKKCCVSKACPDCGEVHFDDDDDYDFEHEQANVLTSQNSPLSSNKPSKRVLP